MLLLPHLLLLQECHLVSRENYFYRSLDPKLLGDIKDELMVRAQEWIGNRVGPSNNSSNNIRPPGQEPTGCSAKVAPTPLIFSKYKIPVYGKYKEVQ